MGALDNLFGQMSEVGTTLPGLGDNTPFEVTPPTSPGAQPITPPPPPATSDEEDPISMFQRLVAENEPLLAASRNAALRTPDKREEEIYKDKIRQMFGVKLGEKNPKWRSGLRGIVEGLDSLAAGYNRTPTIREKARKQAQEDYKLENEVLGKDSTATLARMGQAAQQANLANIQKMKIEKDKILAQAKEAFAKDPNNPKVKLIAAQIENFASKNDLNAMRAKQAEMSALLNEKKAAVTGIPTEIQTLRTLFNDPKLAEFEQQRNTNKAVGSAAARALFGAGGQGSTTVSEKLVPNEQTGRMELETTTSTRTPNAAVNRGTAAEALTRLGAKLPGTEASPGAPVQSGAAPDNSNAAPKTTTTTIAVPKPSGSNPAARVISRQVNAAKLPPADVARMTPTAGKKYQELATMAENMKEINEAIFGAARTFDNKGQSVGDRYDGFGGYLLNMADRRAGDQNTHTALFKETNDRAFNLHRHLITGAGAGWKELDFLKERFPAWGSPWTADNFNTSLQKALILHYTMQKQLWNFEKRGISPEILGKVYNGDKVVQRVDDILNQYKELQAKLPTAPTAQRKALIDKFKKNFESKLDGRDMFEESWREAQGLPPGARTFEPMTPTRKRIRIEVQ